MFLIKDKLKINDTNNETFKIITNNMLIFDYQ